MDINSLHGIFACFATRLLRAPLQICVCSHVAPARLTGADRGFGLPLESSHHQASLNDFTLRRANSALLLCSNLCCRLFRLLQRHGGTSHLLPPTNQLSSTQCPHLLTPLLGLVRHPVCESLHLGLLQANFPRSPVVDRWPVLAFTRCPLGQTRPWGLLGLQF